MSYQAKPEIIINEQIILKRLSHDADQAKYDTIIKNRDHLLPWLPWAKLYQSFEEMPEYTSDAIEKFDKGISFAYDIFYEGQFAGSIDLHNISESDHSAEIGYWLSKEYTGKGIITITAKALIEYAFNDLKMHRIALIAACENKSSCAVAERLGLALEGVLRDYHCFDEKYYDMNSYAILNLA